MVIRPARTAEAGELAALAVRSKAHWPYPPAFVAQFARDLGFTADVVGANDVWVLERDRATVGFSTVLHRGALCVLDDLWVDAAMIGRGYGRLLFEHAAARARAGGARDLEWEAEPYAVGFYERMGGAITGWVDSPLGRPLPVMRLALDRAPAPG